MSFKVPSMPNQSGILRFFNAHETFYLSRNPPDSHDTEWLDAAVVQVGLERRPGVFGNVLSSVLAFR